MINAEIRMAIFKRGLKHYEVAEQYGTSSTYFCTLLRRELSDAKKEKIMQAIERCSKQKIDEAIEAYADHS